MAFPGALLEARTLALLRVGTMQLSLYQVLWWHADVVEYAEHWVNSGKMKRCCSPGQNRGCFDCHNQAVTTMAADTERHNIAHPALQPDLWSRESRSAQSFSNMIACRCGGVRGALGKRWKDCHHCRLGWHIPAPALQSDPAAYPPC